jgi:hypothetical protein
MPVKQRLRTPYSPQLDLPPPFRLLTLREAGNAFAHAMAVAAQEGAGTLVYVGRFDLAEFALVLEPDEPLRSARRTFYAGMGALGDALAALAPPEKPIAFDWPDAIRIDGGLVGGGRLGWPEGAHQDAVPPWLVFAGMIRTAALTDDPSRSPFATALDQEGFDEAGANRVVESFARNFLRAVDRWGEHGFAPVARDYLLRLASASGTVHQIEANGDLLVRREGAERVARRALLPKLARPSWLDPETGAPRG